MTSSEILHDEEVLTIVLPKKFAASMIIALSDLSSDAEIVASAYYKGIAVGAIRQTLSSDGILTINFPDGRVFDRIDILASNGDFIFHGAIPNNFMEKSTVQ